jgi:hypothetical protein
LVPFSRPDKEASNCLGALEFAQFVNGLTSGSHRAGLRLFQNSWWEYLYSNSQTRGVIMPAIFDLMYREYCRARLAEMRKQLLISPDRYEVPETPCDAKNAVGASPAGGSETTTQRELLKH